MPISVSMFLFEILIDEIKSYTEYKEFYIKSKFADVFNLNLKESNSSDPLIPKVKKFIKKTKVRNAKASSEKLHKEGKVQSGQFILYNSHITTLMIAMKKFNIELSLFDKDHPNHKLGSTNIPWSPIFIGYLDKLSAKRNVPHAHVSGTYNVYDDFTCRCIATVKINIKLTHLKNKTTSFLHSLCGPQNNYISKPKNVRSTIRESPSIIKDETGAIKTVSSSCKRKTKTSNKPKINNKKIKEAIAIEEENTKRRVKKKIPNVSSVEIKKENLDEKICETKSSRLCLVMSDSNLDKKIHNDIVKTRSCSSINPKHYNILNYVFGDRNRSLGNQVFCVGYFTVEDNLDARSSNNANSSKLSFKSKSLINFEKDSNGMFKIPVCDEDCPAKNIGSSRADSVCTLDIPEDVEEFFTVTKCKNQLCSVKDISGVPLPPDESILLDLSTRKKECCSQLVGGMQTKMKYDEKNCLCSCECTFGFQYAKKTTYCGICGGYEYVGAGMSKKDPNAPFPCPAYYKLGDKGKLKTSASESDRSRSSTKKGSKSPGSGKSPNSAKSPSSAKSVIGPKEIPPNETVGKKKNADDRFKFNYGFTAAQIGHSKCATPCSGTLSPVPKNMGWLWTADDVPGMKFRPDWRPGATHKYVVRCLRMAKNPDEVMNVKKRGKDLKKKPLKRPLLTVAKKDGEYTVTMETMKIYPNQRAVNQHPYEDKPLLTYTIGRTEEENRERQKKKEREQRRLERDKRAFIQSAFNDMCNEICLKTYQQALGLLPNAEDPDCLCYPKNPGADLTNLDRSCSCSEPSGSLGSDTDSDEWIVEFTPPNATFNPTYKNKAVIKEDVTTQYSYLDYKVKLLDRYGNEVPRYFKGPDGKRQCSDLGGFWSPDHKWLEINIDGFIGPDERWAPVDFIGPNGEEVNCTSGKFQTVDGVWLVVGEDGFVDSAGKWKYYPKRNRKGNTQKKRVEIGKKGNKGTQF